MICLLGCKQNEGAQQNTEGEVRLATGHTHHAETKMGREQFLLRLGRIHILFCGVFSHVFQHWPCFLSRECHPKRSSLRQCERTSGRAATSLQRMLSRGGEQWMDNIKPPAQVHWSCLSTSHSNWAYQYLSIILCACNMYNCMIIYLYHSYPIFFIMVFSIRIYFVYKSGIPNKHA